MPRPRQRRGADAKKEEKRMKREREEADARAKEAAEKRARYRKTELPWNAMPTASGSGGDGERPVDPNALPEVDPDTKAYFQQIADKIDELEALGVGSYGRAGRAVDGEGDGEDLEPEEDDRPLLLRSALESLSGQEVPLAGDGETSIILERLLYAMDDFAKRVLADRFSGQYDKLVKHRAASHVLQTLFSLAGATVDRETRGIVATPPASSASTSTASELPTMTALALSALSEIRPALPELLYDAFGSHMVRVFLLLFAGAAPTSTAASAERSKKSQKFRKDQGKMKSFLAPDADDVGQTSDLKHKRRVPPEFQQALKDMFESLNGVEATGPAGEGVRRAAMDDVAGPAVRIMLELEASAEGGWQPGSWADRVLCGLVEEVSDPSTATAQRTDLREEYLAGLLRHPASAPTFETLLLQSSQAVFAAIWAGFFENKLHRLAGNAVANFVVAVGIKRLDAEQFKGAVGELRKIATERRAEWIDNSRTGVIRATLDRAAELGVLEGEVSEMIVDTFGLNEKRELLVPCVLSLNRYEYFKKLPAHVTSQATTQGSILLQSWLKLHSPHQQVVLDSIHSLGYEGILPLTRDATSSRVLDALLSSPTTPPREIRRFLLSLIGHYHTLSDDRIGSRVVERCWATADVYLKDKIAASLVDQGHFLQSSQFGHFFARKVELPLFMRRREEWKAKMTKIAAEQKGLRLPGGAPQAPAPVATEEKKRRERPVDEVDEIFSSKLGGGKKARTGGDSATVEDVPRPKKKKMDGMDDVFAALKASAV